MSLGTGLREHELIALCVGDVFRDGRPRRRLLLSVFKGAQRTGGTQEVLLSESLRGKLRRFHQWKARERESLDDTAPLFSEGLLSLGLDLRFTDSQWKALYGAHKLLMAISGGDGLAKSMVTKGVRLLGRKVGGALRTGWGRVSKVFKTQRVSAKGGPEPLDAIGAPPKRLPQFTKSTVDDVVASAGRLGPSGQIQEGARAIAKKLGHAQSGGYTSAFAGVKPTQANAEAIIRSTLQNPARTVHGDRVIDVYNAAGQGGTIRSSNQRLQGLPRSRPGNTMNSSNMTDDARVRPDLFQWNGRMDSASLQAWLSSNEWVGLCPSDLLAFWQETGGWGCL